MGGLKMINRKFLAAFVFVMVLGLSACGSAEHGASDINSIQAEPVLIETENVEQGAGEHQEETKEYWHKPADYGPTPLERYHNCKTKC